MQTANHIVNLVVHKLIKDQHEAASIELAETITDVNTSAQRLIDHLHKLYSERPSKGYGKFENDEDNFPMPKFMREYFVDRTVDYYSFSCRMVEHLKARANEEQFATGGYVLISHVNNGATDFILVAIVTEVVGSAITKGLEIVDSVHLDMSNFRVAGRVNLSDWRAGSERYVSFLKGRNEVASYFKKFLGCNDILVALIETQKLVKALESFVTEKQFEPNQRDRFFEQAYDFLQELSLNNLPVTIEMVSNRLWPESPDDLKKVLVLEDIQLSDGFVPDRRAIKGLVKFKAKSLHWKIEFDRKGLRNGDIAYDQQGERLILTNIPATLRKELLEELNNE